MKCPKCGEEMLVQRCGLTKIYICPKCNPELVKQMSEIENEGRTKRYS